MAQGGSVYARYGVREREHARFRGGDREAGLAPKLEGDFLNVRGLREVEDDVAGEEGGVDVDAGTAEDEGIGGDEDVEVGDTAVLLLPVHVVVVVWGMCGGGGEGVKGGVEGGDKRVLVWVGVVHVRAWGRGSGEDEGHDGQANSNNGEDEKGKLQMEDAAESLWAALVCCECFEGDHPVEILTASRAGRLEGAVQCGCRCKSEMCKMRWSQNAARACARR